MMKRKDDVVKGLVSGVGYLLKKHKITHLAGTGTFVNADTLEVAAGDGSKATYKARNFLIATGSTPIQINGLAFDGNNVLSSTEALSLPAVPKKLLIVGGGYIGVELGSVWSRLGAEVTIVEFTPGILPVSDREMANALLKSLQKQGIETSTSTPPRKAPSRPAPAWSCRSRAATPSPR